MGINTCSSRFFGVRGSDKSNKSVRKFGQMRLTSNVSARLFCENVDFKVFITARYGSVFFFEIIIGHHTCTLKAIETIMLITLI